MRNLVLLIVMVLAGAAGWYAGSWSGKDAIAALAKAKDLGEQAQAEHDKVVKGLNQRLAGLSSEFEQGQKKLETEHAQAKAEFNAVLAGRDQRIAELGKVRSVTQTRIVTLQQAVASPTIDPEERNRLQAEITKLEKTVTDQQTLIAGLECSKVAVPAELLAPLRGGQP